MHQKGKHLFLLFIVISFFSSTYSQVEGWTMLNCGKDLYLTDVWFVNADTGWVVGYERSGTFGYIMASVDGGISWTVQDSSATEFMGIQFTDKDHGWAVGYRNSVNYGAIYHTDNGGESWYLKDSCRYELTDLFFLNQDTGYVVGGGRGQTAVLRTMDAGESWDSLTAWGGHMHTVFFANDSLGWVAGEGGAVAKTLDGGESWNTTLRDLGYYHISDLQAIDQDNVWMVGEHQVFRSVNGGDDWESMVDNANVAYKACFFNSSKSGWVALSDMDNSEIHHTSDGGESWQEQALILNLDHLSSFCFINDTVGWCTGSHGVILKTSSAGIVSLKDKEKVLDEEEEPFKLQQNFPNPFEAHTSISYNLASEGVVRLAVYNIQGEEVRILVNGKRSAGKHSLIFDGTGLPSGLYYYRLTDQFNTYVKAMLLLGH